MAGSRMSRRRLLGPGALATLGLTTSAWSARAGERLDTVPDDELIALDGSDRDASITIQRLIDEGTGLVVLPRGRYRIDRPIRIDLARVGPTAIVGQGGATLVATGPGPAMVVEGTHEGTANPESVDESLWRDERLPILDGFAIEGDHPDSIGVRLIGTFQATLHRLMIRRCRVGVHLTGRNRNLIISACHIYHCRELGIHFDRVNLHQAIVADSHVSYASRAGILLEGGELRNFQIVGNDIEYNYDSEKPGCADVLVDLREDGSTFREGTIVGNTIQARPSPGGANVRVLGGESLRTSGLLAITGNLIGSQQTNIHLDRCRGVSIAGNSIYSAMRNSLFIERSANVTVAANPIDWNPDTRGKSYLDGITIRECQGVTVSDLVLENCLREQEAAIEVSASQDVTLDSCQVLDPAGVGIRLRDVRACRVGATTIRDRRVGDDRRMTRSLMIEGESSRDCLIHDLIVDADSLAVAPNSAKITDVLEITA